MQFRQVNEETTELLIYGEIAKKSFWEVLLGVENPNRIDALSFKEAIDKVDTPKLSVRINSMGGSVSEGLAIYNSLKEFDGKVTTIVDGFACSAASFIFMAGYKRIMPESSLLMIHNAWSYAEGDHNAMLKAAEDLKVITQPSINIYKSVSNLSEEEIKEMMDKETWIDANKAFEYQFSTAIERSEAKQSINDRYLRKLIQENQELKELKNLVNDQNTEKEESSWKGYF